MKECVNCASLEQELEKAKERIAKLEENARLMLATREAERLTMEIEKLRAEKAGFDKAIELMKFIGDFMMGR